MRKKRKSILIKFIIGVFLFISIPLYMSLIINDKLYLWTSCLFSALKYTLIIVVSVCFLTWIALNLDAKLIEWKFLKKLPLNVKNRVRLKIENSEDYCDYINYNYSDRRLPLDIEKEVNNYLKKEGKVLVPRYNQGKFIMYEINILK